MGSGLGGGVLRFKSSIGVQLTVTLSCVLLVFAVVFALFISRHVAQFSDAFSERAVETLRHRVEINVADRVKVRALHYGHLFENVAANSIRLADKASHCVSGPASPLGHCEPFPPLLPTPSGAQMGSFDAPVLLLRLPDPATAASTTARLSCLVPYLETLGHASVPTSAAYAVTTDGLLMYYPSTAPRAPFSHLTMAALQAKEWFRAAAPEKNPSQGTVWTSIYTDSVSGGAVITASTPIVAGEGDFRGVVGIDLPLEGLFDEILHGEGVPVEVEGMFWFLVDMNGSPIVFPEDRLGLFGLQAPLAGGGRRGVLDSSDPGIRRYARGLLSLDKGDGRLVLGGSPWIISHHAMPCTGWVLGVVIPDHSILAGLDEVLESYRLATHRMGWEIVVVAVVFTALVLGLFYSALKERLVRPLRMLASQARRVSQGDLEVETVALEGEDEIACLASSFDQMIASLKESRHIQERTTEDLEARVRARTREVEAKAEELHTALTELTTIFSNSMVGIMFLKGGRTLWKANRRMARILGYDSPEEMTGLSIRELHLSEEKFLHYGTLHYEALIHGERMQIEYQLRRRDGSPVWCSLSGKAVDPTIPPDLNKGVLWMVDDITARKVSEQAIRESEERFREMAELLPCIVCEVDTAFRVTYVNSLGMKVFGLSPKDFQTSGIALQAIHPDDRQKVVARMEIVLGGGAVEPTEYRMIRGDGEEITVLFHSAPIIRNGAVLGIRASVTDITEYRAMQETVLTQRKLDLIGSLTGGIAHDFNNMLAVMLGRVELAALSIGEENPARVHLETMVETLGRARDLMDRLITLSTQGEGVALSISLQEVLRRAVADAGGEAAHVFLEIAAEVPRVPVDGGQMGRAVGYVLKNAQEAYDGIGAMDGSDPEEGGVWVTCALLEAGSPRHPNPTGPPLVEVAVRDKGRGIDREHLPLILDPYYTTKERSSQKGMGLGLAVTHAVVTRHGGTLSVISRPGKGTTVFIRLPLGEGREGSET